MHVLIWSVFTTHKYCTMHILTGKNIWGKFMRVLSLAWASWLQA